MEKESTMPSAPTPFPKIDESKAYIYHYIFDIVFTHPNDKKIKIRPIKIKEIYQECDYYKRFSPFFSMNCLLNIYDIMKLKKIEKEIITNITVTSKIYVRQNHILTLVDQKIESSGVFTPIFGAGALDGIPDTAYEETHPVDEKSNFVSGVQDDDPEYKEINVTFIDMVASNIAKAPFNYCIDKGWKVGDLILHIASETKAKGYLIDLPDNQEEQAEAIIPPNNFIQTMNTIQSVFGIYNNGLLIFYHDDVLYILNKFATTHDHKKEEQLITNLFIQDTRTNPVGTMDIFRNTNDKKEAQYLGPIGVHPQNMDLILGESKANTMIFSNFTLGHNALLANESKVSMVKSPALSMKRANESHKHSGTRINFDYDELNNPFNMASYFTESEAESNVVSFKIDNANINDFRCNKYILPTFRNTSIHERLNGVYHIKRAQFRFTPIGNNQELKCESIIDGCKRIKK